MLNYSNTYRYHQRKDVNPSKLTGRNLSHSAMPTFVKPSMMVCQMHIMNLYEEDWINMEEPNFLDALRAYKNIDQCKRRIAEASKEKEKKRRADAPNTKSKGKRTTDDDVNPRSTKCYRDRDGYRGKSREREPYSYCSKQTNWKRDRANTHTTECCYYKDKRPKESNLASRMERIEKILEKSIKRSKKDSNDSSDSN